MVDVSVYRPRCSGAVLCPLRIACVGHECEAGTPRQTTCTQRLTGTSSGEPHSDDSCYTALQCFCRTHSTLTFSAISSSACSCQPCDTHSDTRGDSNKPTVSSLGSRCLSSHCCCHHSASHLSLVQLWPHWSGPYKRRWSIILDMARTRRHCPVGSRRCTRCSTPLLHTSPAPPQPLPSLPPAKQCGSLTATTTAH